MKKIVIFGGTGMTGTCALEHAVKKGLEVRAFVRDESKIPEHIRGKVEAFVGDVTNSDQVSEAVADREGVVVVLGTRNDLKPTTVLSDGTKNILKAMKTHGVKVISVCLSAFLFYEPEKVPAIFKDLNADHQRMFDAVKESGLDWISVLPPHIADSPSSSYTIKHGEGPGRAISKHDLGAFLVDTLEKPENYQKSCGIATEEKFLDAAKEMGIGGGGGPENTFLSTLLLLARNTGPVVSTTFTQFHRFTGAQTL